MNVRGEGSRVGNIGKDKGRPKEGKGADQPSGPWVWEGQTRSLFYVSCPLYQKKPNKKNGKKGKDGSFPTETRFRGRQKTKGPKGHQKKRDRGVKGACPCKGYQYGT